jgi:prophage regulatory protein
MIRITREAHLEWRARYTHGAQQGVRGILTVTTPKPKDTAKPAAAIRFRTDGAALLEERTRAVHLKEVLKLTGLTQQELGAQISMNNFPAQTVLGGTAIGWLLSDVDKWLAANKPKRKAAKSIS